MSGYVGDLSPIQEGALAEFRQSLSDVLRPEHDDHLLLQFLRARRFDLKKSEDMFRKHLQFRQKFDEHYFLTEYKPPELLVQYLLPPLLGFDKGGSPVRLVYAGVCDIKGVVSCIRREEIRRCITWFLDQDKERMRKRSRETGVHVETRTFVFDLNGLSLRQIYHKEVYDLVISFLKLYEGNYPENLKVAYVINTPSFFAWMFSMIKSLLSEDTVDKLRIYGYSGWKEDLLEAMDADILPVIYGGTRTDEDGDPRCRKLIPQGGPIPTHHYLKNTQRLSRSDANVHKVTIGRRSRHGVPLTVDVAGSTVCWEVDCKNCDVQLLLAFDCPTGNEVVVEPIRIDDAFGVEKGYFLAERVGTYTLVLDNSYSFLRSKTVLYKAFVSTYAVDNYQDTKEKS